jgi:predicted RecB family nuclease
MDTLALLCNLHAEGPATLRKLRELGCSTIDELARLPQATLARVLAARPDAAQRFVDEGRLLAQRFAPGPRPSPEAAPPRPAATVVSEPAPEPHPLVPGIVEGLDREWCRALVGQGILTLEQLVDAPGLALARALRLPFTRLLEVQCLARRELASRPARPSERVVLLQPQRGLPAARVPARSAMTHPERPVASTVSALPSPGSGGPFSDIGA